jgi:predicted KAP-like P-loop ATPase
VEVLTSKEIKWSYEKRTEILMIFLKNTFNTIVFIILINLLLTLLRSNFYNLQIPISYNWVKWGFYGIEVILLVITIASYLFLGMIGITARSKLFSLRSDFIIFVMSASVIFNYLLINGPFTYFTGSILSDSYDILMIYSCLIMVYFIIMAFVRIRLFFKGSNIESSENSYFQSDLPINRIDEDRLNREPFARRIAQALERPSKTSLTIGMLGEWGSGKSSVYNMVKEICGSSKYLFIDFKPWYFGQDNHDIIRIYLNQFLEEIKKTKGFNPKLAKALRSYVSLLSSVSIRNFGAVISLKDSFEKFFPSKEAAKLQDIKKEIEELLMEYPKRIVVYIDDIDRLDGAEVRMIFKLVRLIADFSNVTYIIALDEDMIIKSLTSIYEENDSNDKVDAKKYIEKFIQVPIYLPKIDPEHLNAFCWKALSSVMESNGLLKYYDEQLISFLMRRNFSPRNIFRYINLIQFYLSFLKDEINPRDLLYLLLIQLDSSDLYNFIYKNKDLFLENNNEIALSSIPKFHEYEDILKALFPYMPQYLSINKDVKITDQQKREWDTSKRICSYKFFNQYFIYGVPKGVISQETLNVFFEKLLSQSIEKVQVEYVDLLSEYSAVEVNGKIESRIEDIQENKVKMLEVLKNSYSNFYSKTNRDTCVSISSLARSLLQELLFENYSFNNDFWQNSHLLFALSMYNYAKDYPCDSNIMDLLTDAVKSGFISSSDIIFSEVFHRLDAKIVWQYWTDFFSVEEIKDVVKNWLDEDLDNFEKFLYFTFDYDNKKIVENDELLISLFVATTKFLTDNLLLTLFQAKAPRNKAELTKYKEKYNRRNVGIFLLAKYKLYDFVIEQLDDILDKSKNQNIYAQPKQYIIDGSELVRKFSKNNNKINRISEIRKWIEEYNSYLDELAEEARLVREEIDRDEPKGD